jgi:hypothetical protein
MHQQISEMLIREIAAGRMIDGEKLPPEREMATGLSIAVGTLRKALADLDRKGLLERIQGSGNYVRARPDVASIYSMFRLELVEGGGLPTARVLSVDRLPKTADMPQFGSNAEGHRIRRLRSLGGPKLMTAFGPMSAGVTRGNGWLPMLRAGFLTRGRMAQVPLTYGSLTIVDSSFVRTAHRMGVEVHVWTIDDPETMRGLLDLGVDGIVTDRPDLLRAVLIERDVWPATS